MLDDNHLSKACNYLHAQATLFDLLRFESERESKHGLALT